MSEQSTSRNSDEPWPMEGLEFVRKQYMESGPSLAAHQAYINGLVFELRRLLASRSEQGTSDREGRAAIMDRTIYHRMLTDLCTLILGSAAPIGPMRSRADYPPELAKAIKWLKDVQAREQARPAERLDETKGEKHG